MGTTIKANTTTDAAAANAAMLKSFMDKYGAQDVLNDVIGDLTSEMTFADFLTRVKEKGFTDIVKDMTLGNLFGVKAKTMPQPELKKLMLEIMAKTDGLTISEIAERVGESGRHLNIALAVLKKTGKVTSEGEKKATTYMLAESDSKSDED